MKKSAQEMLRMLGAGEPIVQVCKAAAISREEFDTWWRLETRSRISEQTGVREATVKQGVEIRRDGRGVPHIRAGNDEDLFFGFGHALAQDRLFQIDYLRRRGSGRLAEIFGPNGAELDLMSRIPGFQSILELDLLARTVGLRQIAEKEWTTLSSETRQLLSAYMI